MDGIVDFLLENPVFLLPILLLAATLVYALLKKLLKLAAIVAITGVLHVLFVEYFGSGF